MQIANNNLPEDIQQAKLRFGIVGSAPALVGAVQRAIKVAPIDLSVLVVGESGAGKEFFPKIIHAYSARKHAKYIAVNCGAIPEGTIDSELFGHEKGSFTGAVASRKGYFEEADGGTIFLDEVAELPLTTQARLLRVLETGEYIKVGSSEVQKTDIRVVAATNVDMARAVAEGRFREDLFYRLATVSITVPPLRERGNDIQLLARKFASDFAEKNRTPQISFSDGARDRMLAYRWPGNVRQLKNVVEQMALFEAGNEISPETLAGYLPEATATLMPVLHQSRNLPATTGRGDGDHTYEREREMLFSLIFKMREEIEQLRADVDELKGEKPSQPASSLVKLRPAIIDTPVEIMDAKAEEMPPHDAGLAAATQAGLPEKEVIRLSLQRNSGRRKAAAMELNISERTLYRKIKEYGLE